MPSKNYTLFFIFSVGFVLISIAFITILGQTSKKDGENVDIRAKATVANSLKLIGIVTDVKEGSITVGQLKFESKKDEASDMGTWEVTIPPTVNHSGVSIGKKVFINADASTFNTAQKTMTALAITPL
jgi:hypothetical protein